MEQKRLNETGTFLYCEGFKQRFDYLSKKPGFG